jgi:hypothetical protein
LQIAQIIALLATPVIVAAGGWWIQFSSSKDASREKYVELAIGILREKPSDETTPLRRWATHTLALYSPLPFTSSELEGLRSGKTVLPYVKVVIPEAELQNSYDDGTAIMSLPGFADPPAKTPATPRQPPDRR